MNLSLAAIRNVHHCETVMSGVVILVVMHNIIRSTLVCYQGSLIGQLRTKWGKKMDELRTSNMAARVFTSLKLFYEYIDVWVFWVWLFFSAVTSLL